MERRRQVVYLDHAATTAVDPRVVDAMLPFFTERYGNASSIYSLGREAASALDDARQTVSTILNCRPQEVIFTSCGTESDNLAIRGVASARRKRGRDQIITSPMEHHAVSHTAAQLAQEFGFEMITVPVDGEGVVDPADVEAAITDRTALISIMYANNEVGTIQPVREVGTIAREHSVPFHTDAVQAGGSLPLDVQELRVDFLSLSAHKFYGPKGIGVLYARRGIPFLPVQTGGAHEQSRRAGTENVPYIVGLATALQLAYGMQPQENERIAALRDSLVEGILDRIPHAQLTGHPTKRLPNSASFAFKFVEGESILLNLDLKGVAASSGSACTSASLEPSHVLLAMGIPVELAHGSLRLTLGRENTMEDVDYVLEILPPIVAKLRAMSPLYAG
jgi:cysteine desulfurase